MEITYRNAQEKDLSSILEIVKSVSGDYTGFIFEQFLIAETGNKIIGCIRIKKVAECFELASLTVLPEYRNLGIGSNLVIKILEGKKVSPVYVLCSENRESFYKRLGFEKVEINKLPDSMIPEYKIIFQSHLLKNVQIIAMVINDCYTANIEKSAHIA